MKRNNTGLWLLAIIVIAVILVAGCTGRPGSPAATPAVTSEPRDQATPAMSSTIPVPGTGGEDTIIAAGNNRFAFNLYSAMANNPENAGKNIFYSPYSLSSALAIAGEGAQGKTADEILTVLHLPANGTIRQSGFARMNEGINNATGAYTLRTANALWAEKSYPFLNGFISMAGKYYGATLTNLDFRNAPEQSRTTINSWVEQRTNNTIRNLLPQGTIDPLTRLVITNAIYFKGTWVRQFDANLTRDADFRTLAGRTVPVKMMQDTGERAEYPYAETESIQYIELPYSHDSGKSLSLIVILPKGDDIRAAEAVLSERNLSDLQASAHSRRVLLYLPKFRMDTRYELPDTLKSLGMQTAFSPDAADFSGMDGTRNLYISDVIHKAFIDVNEEGTEAAAATAVVMRIGSAAPGASPPVFKADHPFVFLIQDKDTGAILFIGRVADPAGS